MSFRRCNAVSIPGWIGTAFSLPIACVLTAALSVDFCAAAEQHEVFIWYVNETAPIGEDLRNYETIITWLESGETEKAHAYAEGLRNEMTLFREAVDREQATIEAGTLAADGRLDTMIITNRLAREGKYRYYDHASQQFAEAPFSVPIDPDDYVLAANPLVCREALDAVLAEAARRFDPETHDFVLITKSHGGAKLAFAVRLPRHHEEISREQLLASLAGESENIPPPPSIGVTKSEYFAALDEAGRRHGMRFSLVFMESCRGIFEAEEVQQLPSSVQLLYTSGNRTLEYATLDYPALFARLKTDRTLAQTLDEYLSPRYMALFRQEPPVWSRLIWFVPLVVIAMYWWHRSRKSTASPPTDPA